MNWLRRFFRRPLPRVAPPKLPPLLEQDLRAALLVGDDHLLWRAFMQCLDVLREETVQAALEDRVQERAPLLHYYAGGAAMLDRLKAFLVAERDKARTIKDHARP